MSDSRKTAARLAGQIEKTFIERDLIYGAPEDNFTNIAAFWNAWIDSRYGIKYKDFPLLDAFDVAQMSSLIKKARLANSPGHQDSSLDDAVYTLLGAGIGDSLAKGNDPELTPAFSEESLAQWKKSTDRWRDLGDRTAEQVRNPNYNPDEPPSAVCECTICQTMRHTRSEAAKKATPADLEPDLRTSADVERMFAADPELRQYKFWQAAAYHTNEVLAEGSVEWVMSFAKRYAVERNTFVRISPIRPAPDEKLH